MVFPSSARFPAGFPAVFPASPAEAAARVVLVAELADYWVGAGTAQAVAMVVASASQKALVSPKAQASQH